MQPRVTLILLGLAVFSGMVGTAAGQVSAKCISPDACNECVCCCGQGAILSYRAVGCGCKPVYDSAFVATLSLAGLTVVMSSLTGWYFGGRGALSPFPRMPSPSTSCNTTEGGSAEDVQFSSFRATDRERPSAPAVPAAVSQV